MGLKYILDVLIFLSLMILYVVLCMNIIHFVIQPQIDGLVPDNIQIVLINIIKSLMYGFVPTLIILIFRDTILEKLGLSKLKLY